MAMRLILGPIEISDFRESDNTGEISCVLRPASKRVKIQHIGSRPYITYSRDVAMW